MFSLQEARIIDLQDSYTLLYSFIAGRLMEECGLDGEAAVREGLRRYGRDRALKSRQTHLDAGLKINMENLFSVAFDLPGDPRFRREQWKLCPQERISHTLVCPMADVWKEYGAQDIGRIYCEEFHSACYGTYAYGHTQVNLATTLTHREDEYCSFNVVLRPEDLPDELKPVCFAEYDPGYARPEVHLEDADERGFNLLCVKLYYYLLEAAEERLGALGVQAVGHGLEEMALDGARRVRRTAEAYGQTPDRAFAAAHYPLAWDPADEPLWDQKYGGHGARELLERWFYPAFRRELGQ